MPNNAKPIILKKKDVRKKQSTTNKKELDVDETTSEYGNTIQGKKYNFQNYNQ